MVHYTTDSEAEWADAILGTDLCVHDGLNHSLQAEVDTYFNNMSTRSYSSIITFWQVSKSIFLLLFFAHSFQENQYRYPTIFKLAMDVLAIQGSAVPCEHVFSSGKETMSACRSQITNDLMEALQMLKFSLKHNCKLDFTAGSGQQAKLQELEELNYIDSFVLEDLAFQRGFTLALDDNSFSDSF